MSNSTMVALDINVNSSAKEILDAMANDLISTTEATDLLEQRAALAEERGRAASAGKAKPFKIVVGEYQGHTTYALSGNFRPFRMGAGKLTTIIRHQNEIEDAIDANS